MVRRISILFLVIIIGLINFGCKKETSILAPPEKIIVYKNGSKKVLEQSNPSFKNIIILTNKRFSNVCTRSKCVDKKCIQKAKDEGIDIEFIYNQEQEFNVISDGVKQFKYTRLFFPISVDKFDRKEKQIMYYGNGKNYMNDTIVNLLPAEDLVKIINEL